MEAEQSDNWNTPELLPYSAAAFDRAIFEVVEAADASTWKVAALSDQSAAVQYAFVVAWRAGLIDIKRYGDEFEFRLTMAGDGASGDRSAIAVAVANAITSGDNSLPPIMQSHLADVGEPDKPDKPDSKTDNGQEIPTIPENSLVLKLIQKINRAGTLKRGDKTAFALELTQNDKEAAESLLRQLRRHRGLLKNGNS